MNNGSRWLAGRSGLAGVVVALLLWVQPALGIPQFARSYDVSCNACHTVAPMLNERGLAFAARGYLGAAAFEEKKSGTIPLSMWITGRHEEQFSRDFDDTFLPKVELISGGPIAEGLSYFIEWRPVSLETRADGTRRDRSGRFEDAYLNWEIRDRLTLQVGQYRSLQQVDVSRRLSIDEPAIFSRSLPGKPTSDGRIQSLRAFAPSGRSPGLTLGYQSIKGESPADGLFHFLTVPFVGELSIPLTREARREASFELEGPPKGVFLETFYRQGHNSIGAHAFVDDRRWLLTGVGTLAIDKLHLTGSLGVDGREGEDARIRSSLQGEYHFISEPEAVRPAAGFRVEHITDDDPAFIPYIAISGPNGFFTFLFQVQYRAQSGREALMIDLSFLF